MPGIKMPISKSEIHLTLYHTIPTLGKKPFENIVGKAENAGNQHFLLFPFSTHLKTNCNFSVAFNLSSAHAFNLDQSKILLFGKELI